jgi:hypothetical protein
MPIVYKNEQKQDNKQQQPQEDKNFFQRLFSFFEKNPDIVINTLVVIGAVIAGISNKPNPLSTKLTQTYKEEYFEIQNNKIYSKGSFGVIENGNPKAPLKTENGSYYFPVEKDNQLIIYRFSPEGIEMYSAVYDKEKGPLLLRLSKNTLEKLKASTFASDVDGERLAFLLDSKLICRREIKIYTNQAREINLQAGKVYEHLKDEDLLFHPQSKTAAIYKNGELKDIKYDKFNEILNGYRKKYQPPTENKTKQTQTKEQQDFRTNEAKKMSREEYLSSTPQKKIPPEIEDFIRKMQNPPRFIKTGDIDYYTLFGISKNRTEEELNNALRQIKKIYSYVHPDAAKFYHGISQELANKISRELSEATNIFRDPEIRRLYNLRNGIKNK